MTHTPSALVCAGSARLARALRQARPSTFGGVTFEFVAVEETTYDSETDFTQYVSGTAEWKTLTKNVGAPMVVPMVIAATVLLCCCCALGCFISRRNKSFDRFVDKYPIVGLVSDFPGGLSKPRDTKPGGNKAKL